MTPEPAGLAARWIRPILFLGRNRLSVFGAVLTTSAALALIGFWVIEATASRPVHPYAGIIFILGLPFLFLIGLVLIPVGILLERRRLKRAGALPSVYPKLDLADPNLKRFGFLVALLTTLNVIILTFSAYMGADYMESSRFCGLTCHKVMAPEYGAYLDSPHSRVACTSCHIGPGASWAVKAKIDGVRQVVAVVFGTYSRPIPSPVHTLRPARATCEQCHWPQKFAGDKLRIITKFGEDEKNSVTKTVLLLKLGGRTGSNAVGIHGRHLDDKERISYATTDGRREVIPTVNYVDDDGKTVVFASTEIKPTDAQKAKVETRTMDCIDCHNRPTHAYELPERAVNEAMAAGSISADLPFVRKKAVEVLKADYPSREAAFDRIEKDLTEYYKAKYADVYRTRRATVETAVREVQRIYGRNVFPEMRLTWGTHPNHIGHEDFLGCFRCHDGNHKAASGRAISQECDACHQILAQDETNPKILAELGVN
ncbi:MAG: NapC/NirT family cytochrome c [Thermoanaerobaculia bacterium]|jgi:nitrate/TMAO reductase-like tetraheme cytochrome c subunit